MFIHIDHPRRRYAARSLQTKEQLRRDQIPLGRQDEVNRFAGRIHRAIEVCTGAGDLKQVGALRRSRLPVRVSSASTSFKNPDVGPEEFM